jgi:hypothetical protein
MMNEVLVKIKNSIKEFMSVLMVLGFIVAVILGTYCTIWFMSVSEYQSPKLQKPQEREQPITIVHDMYSNDEYDPTGVGEQE